MSDPKLRRGAICGTHETYTVVSVLGCPVCALERAESRVKELEQHAEELAALLPTVNVFLAALAASGEEGR